MSYVMTQDPRISVAEPGDHARERILDAMVQLAGTRPWTSLTEDAICAEADVPRSAFDARFTSVDACFTAAAGDALDRLYGAVLDRTDASDATWPDRVCALVAGFLGFLVTDRERAWIAVVEPLGGRARVARKRTVARLVELAGEAPADDRGEDRAIVASIEPQLAGLWELGRQYLADAGALPLEDVARSTIFRMLAPYLSRDEAMRHAFTTTLEAAGPCVGAAVDSVGGPR